MEADTGHNGRVCQALGTGIANSHELVASQNLIVSGLETRRLGSAPGSRGSGQPLACSPVTPTSASAPFPVSPSPHRLSLPL